VRGRSTTVSGVLRGTQARGQRHAPGWMVATTASMTAASKVAWTATFGKRQVVAVSGGLCVSQGVVGVHLRAWLRAWLHRGLLARLRRRVTSRLCGVLWGGCGDER